MILHITFTDGSNPYVSYGDKTHVIKTWNKWKHLKTARPHFFTSTGKYQCMRTTGGGWAVGRYFDGSHKTYHFERLGNALNAMEKLEEKK